MQAIRGVNTRMEVALGKDLWSKGLRYRKNDKTVFGKPDFTFRKVKVAVFVDGEFFHGKDWESSKHRIQSNQDFWWKKIQGNMERDKVVNKTLTMQGWKVLRFWSMDVKNKIETCSKKVEINVDKRRNDN